MNDAEDLVRRYLALWESYLSALMADPATVEPLRRFVEAIGAGRLPRELDAEAATQPSRSPARAKAAAGTSVERDRLVDELARRVADLEQRLAALERGEREAARPRGRGRRLRG